jgi:hypothetical protein
VDPRSLSFLDLFADSLAAVTSGNQPANTWRRSLVPNSDHRIDSRSFPRGNVTGQKRGAQENRAGQTTRSWEQQWASRNSGGFRRSDKGTDRAEDVGKGKTHRSQQVEQG